MLPSRRLSFLKTVIFLGIRLTGVIIYSEEEFQLAEQKGF
jgi:hypothetical protein